MSEEQHAKLPLIQMLLGFIFVIALGFAVIGLTGKSDEEKEQGALLLQGYQLTQYGIQICATAINTETGSTVFSPRETSGDRINTVTVKWKESDKNFEMAECTYQKAQGILSLVIDGEEKIKQ